MSSQQRLISLLPSATEIIYAIGAGPLLVGCTHECDYPPAAASLPHCTANLLPPNLSAAEIDVAVARTLTDDPHSIYRLDVEAVHALRPSTIVTQSLCAVCAVPESTVSSLACTLPHACKVVSADPHTLEELYGSIQSIGACVAYGSGAAGVVSALKRRMQTVRESIPQAPPSQKVVVLEWPDPPYAPGHWVPDQIEAAGGVCALGTSGAKSVRVSWEELTPIQPAVIICAFCGYDLKQNENECDKIADDPRWREFSKSAAVYASNASAYFSRPGPRLIDGVELLTYVLHKLEQFRPKEPGMISRRVGDTWKDLCSEK